MSFLIRRDRNFQPVGKVRESGNDWWCDRFAEGLDSSNCFKDICLELKRIHLCNRTGLKSV